MPSSRSWWITINDFLDAHNRAHVCVSSSSSSSYRTRLSMCIYLYFFAYFYFSLTTFRTFKYTISNNSTLASPVQQKKQQKTHHNPICATRDFTAVAFLRQISIITKLLFFSALGRKQPTRAATAGGVWYFVYFVSCFSFCWLRLRPPLVVVDQRLWFLSFFSHEWRCLFFCVQLLRYKWSHTNTHRFGYFYPLTLVVCVFLQVCFWLFPKFIHSGCSIYELENVETITKNPSQQSPCLETR